MESCVAAEASEGPPAEPKRARVRKPRAKPEARPETIAGPPPPPSIVVDAPFFASLGGTLRSLQRDGRRAKISSLRIA